MTHRLPPKANVQQKSLCVQKLIFIFLLKHSMHTAGFPSQFLQYVATLTHDLLESFTGTILDFL